MTSSDRVEPGFPDRTEWSTAILCVLYPTTQALMTPSSLMK
jgi:hypothetical protein